jgi:trans-aconitate methyltransferase
MVVRLGTIVSAEIGVNMDDLTVKLAAVRELEGQTTNHCGEMYSRPGHVRRMEMVRSLLERFVRGNDFIDVGCAEGLYCGMAHDLNANSVLGLDVSPTKIDRAMEAYPDCTFRRADASELTELSRHFDVALCGEVLQHVLDYVKVAANLFDCLRPGGHAIITAPNLSEGTDHQLTPISSDMDVNELLAEVGGAGLGRNNGVWKFNTDKFYDELAELSDVSLIEKIAVDTPDGQRKNLWTIGVFRRFQSGSHA